MSVLSLLSKKESLLGFVLCRKMKVAMDEELENEGEKQTEEYAAA